METLNDYLMTIDDLDKRKRFEEIFDWISETFPQLQSRIAWNQPMFTHEGTFIIGFSRAKHHISVAPERVALDRFTNEINKAGYSRSKELFRIPFKMEVDYDLLREIIEFNIQDKAGHTKFWR